ncbi:MAG: hypothetical protein ABSG75_14775 [Syntrophales bacterium]
MKLDRPQTNVSVVARQFNPSIITQHWLIKNGILLEPDFNPECVLSPVVADVRTKEFNFIVVPERLQFIPNVDDTDAECRIIVSKVGRIIELLPETPFVAVGMNFLWFIDLESEPQTRISRKLFFRDGSNLYKKFDAEDAQFGAYMSKEVIGCRLRLNIKPVILTIENEQSPRLQFSFNFHLDLPNDEKVSAIKDFLPNWIKAKTLTREIAECAIQEAM